MENQHLALSMSEEAFSCRNVLEGVGRQLDLSLREVISVETASEDNSVRSNGELACSQKEWTVVGIVRLQRKVQ